MRGWLVYLVASIVAGLACGGREEVAGTPVGTCASGGLGWNCTSPTSDAVGSWQRCPVSVGAGASCATGGSAPPGFTNVITGGVSAPCFQCTSNGLGVVWTCSPQTTWVAGDVFSCSP